MRKNTKMIAVAFLSVFLVCFATFVVEAASYVGNKESMKFHFTKCRTIKHINDAKFIPFDSREAALKAGYVACRVCHP